MPDISKHKQVHFYAEVSGSDYVMDTTYASAPPIENDRYASFKAQQQAQFDLFVLKDNKYGRNNIIAPDNLNDEDAVVESLEGIYFRMKDKLNRYKNLIQSTTDDNGETIEDTLNDLANYANIALMVNKKTW